MDCPHPSTVSFKVESQDMVRFTWVKNCCAESIEGLERTRNGDEETRGAMHIQGSYPGT